MRSKQLALALFVLSAAGLALLVNVVTMSGKQELLSGPGFVPEPFAMALEPIDGEGAEDEGGDDFADGSYGLEGGAQAAAPAEDEEYEPTQAEAEAQTEAPTEDPETAYAALHPVYTRCKTKVDMLGFSLAIQKTCGDIHELHEVAWPCRSAMQDYSKKFGCCWETVMDGYEALYPQAAQSWRLWQGTLSGKAGVTFDAQNCGDSMGEKGYTDLSKQVSTLQNVIETQSNEIMTLESYLGYGGNPYYYYYYKTHPDALKGKKAAQSLAVIAPSKAFHPASLHHRREARRAAKRGGRRALPSLIDTSGSSALRRAGINV